MSKPTIPFSKAAAEAFDRASLSAVVERLRSTPNDDRARMALFVLSKGPILIGTRMSKATIFFANSRD